MFTADQIQEIKRLIRTQLHTKFTDDQIQDIRSLINEELDRRAALHEDSVTDDDETPIREYHTLSDLRCAILGNIDWLKLKLSTEVFHINVVRHYVLQLIEPTPQDLKIDSNGQTKIEHQINNVLKPSKTCWTESPFESVPGMRGTYRFKQTP
jgi:hypothetical protein